MRFFMTSLDSRVSKYIKIKVHIRIVGVTETNHIQTKCRTLEMENFTERVHKSMMPNNNLDHKQYGHS